MNIILNFVPLKSGGGVQVGLDFIAQAKLFGRHHKWFLVATAGTPFEGVESTENFSVVRIIDREISSRILFEYVGCRNLVSEINPDVIYTQFGPHWPGASDRRNVVGCAYSNLFYPELNFWGGLPWRTRLVKKIIDVMRLRRLRSASKVVFETQDLAERSEVQGVLPKGTAAVVMPTASSLVTPLSMHHETLDRCSRIPQGFRIVLLSVYNRNKNIELLPYVAKQLRDKHRLSDVRFIITLPEQAGALKNIIRIARSLGVEENIVNFGPVPYEGCAELYRAADAVILPAQLESFSNSIAEAWKMSRPLIITDMGWARSICDDAAVYVDYDDAVDTARVIADLVGNSALQQELIARGEVRLKAFPSSEARFKAYLALLENA